MQLFSSSGGDAEKLTLSCVHLAGVALGTFTVKRTLGAADTLAQIALTLGVASNSNIGAVGRRHVGEIGS